MNRIFVFTLAAFAAVAFCTPALGQLPPPPPAPVPAPAPVVATAPLPPPASVPAPAPVIATAPLPPPAPVPAPAPVVATAPLPPPASVPAPAHVIATAPLPPPAPAAAQRPTPAPRPAKAAEPQRPPEAPAPPEPVRAGEAQDQDPVNVRFEVTVSSQTGTSPAMKRSAVVTAANRQGSSMLRSGNSVPVPSTTITRVESAKDGTPQPPVTSYNYRAVGLNVDVNNVLVLPGNRVRALLNVEFSGVDEKSSTTVSAPAFPTFSQRMTLYFESGKPLVMGQSTDYVDAVERKQTVEVKATILR